MATPTQKKKKAPAARRAVVPVGTKPDPKKVSPTAEVAIADTRLNILNTVTLFPFNPDDLSRAKGGLEAYDELLRDDQVRAALSFKKASIVGAGWTLTPRGDTPEEQDLATQLEEDLKRLEGTFEDDLWEILSALEYGNSISELVWMLDDGRAPAPTLPFEPPRDADPMARGQDLPRAIQAVPTPVPTGPGRLRLKAIKSKAPHRIDFKVDPFGNIVEIVQLQAWGRTPLPPEKFVHFIHSPNFSNPYGTSDLRAAYKWWFYKQQFLQYWAIWMEMLSTPPFLATYPRNDDDRAAAVRAMLQAVQARTAITVPEGWTVGLLESTRSPEQVFLAAVDRADLGIAKAILVPEKLGLAGGAVRGGSFALSRTQANSFLLVLKQISRRLEATVQVQVIDRMAAFAKPGVPSPEFKLNPIADENRDDALRLWLDAVKAGAVLNELEDENQFRSGVGFPKRESEDGSLLDGPPNRAVPAPIPRQPQGLAGTPAVPRDPAVGARANVVGISGRPTPNVVKASEAHGPSTVPTDFWRTLSPRELRTDMVEKRATVETQTRALARALGEGARALVRDIAARAKKLVGKPPSAVRTLKPSATIVSEIRAKMTALLQETYARSLAQAKAEVRRAKRQDADPRMDFAAGLVGARAAQFFRAQAFQVTGILAADVLEDAQNVLLRTLTQDTTDRQIAFELDQALADFLPETDAQGNVVNVPARLETIARTNVARAVNEARFATFTDPELDSFVAGFEYSAVLDSRTRPHHRAWDGVALAVDDPHWYGPPDNRPPNGFNSFVADVQVSGCFVAGSKARYAGPVVQIETRHGTRLTVTVNHPVLTRRGFVPAHEIRKGDELVVHRPSVEALTQRVRQHAVAPPPVPGWAVDDEDVPPRIEQVFDAFLRHATPTTFRTSARCSPLDFHGDAVGYQGHVHIVGADGLLPSDGQSGTPQAGDECALVVRGNTALAVAHAARVDRAARAVRVGPAANLYAPLQETPADSSTRGMELLCDPQFAHARGVEFDHVVHVDVRPYVGHVYDLQSPNGWIVANGVVASNCRCLLLPVTTTDGQEFTPPGQIPQTPAADEGFK